jgi:hypothetical protein
MSGSGKRAAWKTENIERGIDIHRPLTGVEK